ncbi:DUF4349 domain-containing protein [Streptomyces sp. NRRL F-5727]|uniref:DUF4349 domain-containing protein n=1 Tax=Streptomyces sp. NRRL F-5727 TaxID=1463871 RepID=UPI0004CBA5F2|nr:DUF4349 domain-containing protein [Streptomyces sp. NRRL F-5727]
MHISDRTTRTARRGRAGAALLLAASLALTAGCGAGSADSGGDAKGSAAQGELDHKGAADGTTGGATGGATGGSSGAEADAKPGTAKPGGSRAPAAQHVIRTASLSVEVERVAETADRVRAVATAAGGRVESETTERVDDEYDHSTMVLRVPQDRYDRVLAELAGTGKLLARKAEAQDVTDQVVDVESRIATQRASVARVRALMDRAERLTDVVTLEGELSRRQADLEALLAQQASLKDRTSLATITVSLSEKARVTVEDERTDDSRPAVGDALSGGWNALVAVVAWTLVVLAALAPWLAAALAAYAVWRWGVRPRRRARAAAPAPRPAPVPAAVPGQAARTNAAGLPLPDEAPDGQPAGAPDAEGSAP